MKNKILIILTTISLFFVDFFSKSYVVNNFTYGGAGQLTLIENIFNIKLVHNYGAAFSFLSDWEGAQIYIFSFIAIGMILYFMYEITKGKNSIWMNVIYATLIAGAAGNLYDRLTYGYVIDFLDVHIFNYDFPIFNIADIYITCGFVALILLEIRKKEHGK